MLGSLTFALLPNTMSSPCCLDIMNEPKNYVKNGSHTLGPTLSGFKTFIAMSVASASSSTGSTYVSICT
jgi:hypothetical protein